MIVATVTASNDYSKQQQFRELEISSQKEERISVLRSGIVHRVNPDDVVVGDVLILQPGDILPADCVIIPSALVCSNMVKVPHRHHHHHHDSDSHETGDESPHKHHRHHHHHHHSDDIPDEFGNVGFVTASVYSDESSLTGEAEEIEKSVDGDCFLLSSCLLTSGEQQYAVVISTGLNSQWGKIKSSLVTSVENTPMQKRLAKLTTSVS